MMSLLLSRPLRETVPVITHFPLLLRDSPVLGSSSHLTHLQHQLSVARRRPTPWGPRVRRETWGGGGAAGRSCRCFSVAASERNPASCRGQQPFAPSQHFTVYTAPSPILLRRRKLNFLLADGETEVTGDLDCPGRDTAEWQAGLGATRSAFPLHRAEAGIGGSWGFSPQRRAEGRCGEDELGGGYSTGCSLER